MTTNPHHDPATCALCQGNADGRQECDRSRAWREEYKKWLEREREIES